MSIEVAGSLIPGTVNTPLDQRTRVNALSEVSGIENPFVGMKFYCLATGKTYTVKSLKAKLIGSFTVQDAMVDEYVADLDRSDLSDGSDWSDLSDRVDELGKAVAALQENDAAALAIIGEEET